MVANIGISQPDYILIKSDPPNLSNEDSLPEEEDVALRGGATSKEDSGSANEGSANEKGSASETQVRPAESARQDERATAGEGTRAGEEGEEGRGRNSEVVKVHVQKSASEELLQPTIQALAVLSNVSALKLQDGFLTIFCSSAGFGTLY